ncbi:MAG: DUF4302 domain-containing protein [Mediterranea sp.]|jgi:hypothetical protein|nr:DUF4302 domain-containing protein [Mediterranea sp.]
MKRKLYTAMIALATLLTLTVACAKEEEDLFGQPAAVRIDQLVASYRQLLTNATDGWYGNYYPEEKYSIGGYAMYFHFGSGTSVDIACQIATTTADITTPAGTTATSTWTIDESQGPVLSFNTFNPVLNYFSYVSGSGDLNGLAGDYEFVIIGVSDDQNRITLKGKKRGNLLVLTRNVDKEDPAIRFAAINDMANIGAGFVAFKVEVDGVEAGSGPQVKNAINIDTWATGTSYSDSKLSFAYTTDGIELYQPVTINGVTMEHFRFDEDNQQYVCVDEGTDAKLTAYFPADYQLTYHEYMGNWTLEYETTGRGKESDPTKRKQTDVTISQDVVNSTLTLSAPGIFDFGTVKLTFDPAKGMISLLSQYIDYRVVASAENYSGSSSNYGTQAWLRLCPISDTSTSTGTNEGTGVKGEWDADAQIVTFVSNGVWSRNTTGLAIRMYQYGTSNSLSGDYKGNVEGACFTYLKLIKKN